jgi:hypothetical protein
MPVLSSNPENLLSSPIKYYLPNPIKSYLPKWAYKILIGAGNEIRTRDTKLGKLVLYQLSYARIHSRHKLMKKRGYVNIKNKLLEGGSI